MAGQQQQQGRNKRKSGGGGGGGTGRVFISFPSSGDVVKAGSKSGEIDVAISLQQAHGDPKFPVATKVFINDRFMGHVDVQRSMNRTFTGVKHTTGNPLKIRAEKAGFPNEKDELEIPAEDLKSALKKTSATTTGEPRRLKVVVGPLTPNRINPVSVFLRDKDGNPEAGTVSFSLGQGCKINGNDWNPADEARIDVGVDGKGSVDVQLLERDATIPFLHVESGETIFKSLLKEE